jgi:hypothetical protein
VRPDIEHTAEQYHQGASGRWVTAMVYAKIFALSEGTLATWRFQDKNAQPAREAALPGYPVYRRFGRSIRYWLPVGSYDPAVLSAIPATRYRPRKRTAELDHQDATPR